MPRPSRKQREIDQTRDQILDAAALVFAAKGFEAATMQEIAAAAQYSAPTLYGYFDGKQAILDALQTRHRENLKTLIDVELPKGVALTLREKLELWLRYNYAWLDNNRDCILLNMRHPRPDSSNDGKPSRWDVYSLQLARLDAWFRENIHPEELHGRDPSQAALVFGGIAQAFFMQWFRAGGLTVLNDSVPIVLDMFLYGLCGQSEAGAAPSV